MSGGGEGVYDRCRTLRTSRIVIDEKTEDKLLDKADYIPIHLYFNSSVYLPDSYPYTFIWPKHSRPKTNNF